MINNISILGSTGSIGEQTIEVAQQLGLRVRALAAKRNIKRLEEQARALRPDLVAVYDESQAGLLEIALADTPIRVFKGEQGVIQAAVHEKSERVVAAVVGMEGIRPIVEAIRAGKDIALANKEALVTAGEIIMSLAHHHGVAVIPVDSEHSALFQCMQGVKKDDVRKMILTASGGPFLRTSVKELETVTKKQALAHPNWKMGSKITIDSATMMNKGFEVIEAMFLFDVPAESIETIVHPQSIIHSAVECIDGSVLAQMGKPSMHLPIHYAMTWPKRKTAQWEKLDFSAMGTLTFEKPDMNRFECLKLAYNAAKDESCMRISLNTANDLAVDAFYHERIGFMDIARIVRYVTEHYPKQNPQSLEEILCTVDDCRRFTLACIKAKRYRVTVK